MEKQSGDAALPTLARSVAGPGQRTFAALLCASFVAVTVALVPFAAHILPPMPGFVAGYQMALIVIYAVTSFLFFTQYRRSRSMPLLLLATGSLYTTLIVTVQLLSFPNIFAPGRIVGAGPETTTWLWTFWHIGPPLFALPYAIMEGSGTQRDLAAARAVKIGRSAVLGTLCLVGAVTVLVTRFVSMLPKTVDGDDYSLVASSGVGPAVIGLTLASLAVLVWRTRLRTVLQLWLAVSLFLLVDDSVVTLVGGSRGSLGWYAGRIEALVAGILVLGVYLRELDFLYARAEQTALERERERAELQVARDDLAFALDAAAMGAWELDLAAGASRRTLRHDRIFGFDSLQPRWGRDELLALTDPEDRAAVDTALAQAAAGGGLDTEYRIRRAGDGASRWIALRGKAYADASGRTTRLAGVVMDTTDRHETEQKLQQAQKMEAIGQLTGGIAHDFNNLLTIIVGNLDMISRKPDNVERVRRLASSSILAARRGADVTQKLLAFSRRQVLRPETVNPNGLLKDFRPLLGRAVGEAVTIELDLDASLFPVRLDPGQFESAILNLAVNARDAMPGGGTLTLRTCNLDAGSGERSGVPDISPGDYVAVSAADTGTGMDEETLGRVFEPFFTTKDVGKGTGLGLSQVYGFAKQAGGTVRIESGVGRGSTVTLYLPRSTERMSDVPSHRSGMPLRRAASGEVVLVVEDEAAVLDMAVESLGELGYATRTATNAAAAIALLRGESRIDILFSDIIMPGGMNGVQLSVEARRLRPGLRVLLTSGYTGSSLDENGMPDDLPLLTKPYLREDLAAKLRIVMAG